ncbi:MAG: SLC13 family permease [Candidatus Micrarchaeota archaeon]|nr:SLC13 family permease [Candidatus Micrarchaeota archaeon]
MLPLAVVVLAAVLAAILLRDLFRLPFAPWQAMLSGAAAVLLLGQISPEAALASIDWEVMLFLYGMFLLAHFLAESWYLEHLGYKVLHRFRHPFFVLLAIVFSIGIASAFLLNDTIAIIGVPLCIMAAGRSKIAPGHLLVALALAVTIGGVASPLGSPQNFIISRQPQLPDAFSPFVLYLGLPTVLSLAGLTALLWFAFPPLRRLRGFETDVHVRTPTYYAARRGLQVVLALSLLRLAAPVFPFIPQFPLYLIALAGASTSLLLSRNWKALAKVDWETLVFFAAMFVLMESVWLTGFFQQFLPPSHLLSKPETILGASLVLSQLLSNVPFVILYLKALGGSATPGGLMLLAAGSTLAGGLTIVGAASNIIILQSAEKRGQKFPVLQFTLVGIAATAISVALILGWMALIRG